MFYLRLTRPHPKKPHTFTAELLSPGHDTLEEAIEVGRCLVDDPRDTAVRATIWDDRLQQFHATVVRRTTS